MPFLNSSFTTASCPFSLQHTTAASDQNFCPWTPAQRPSQVAASPPPRTPSLQPTTAASDQNSRPWTPAQRPSQAAASPSPRARTLQPSVAVTDSYVSDAFIGHIYFSRDILT